MSEAAVIHATTSGAAPYDRRVSTFEQHRVELTGYCYRMLGSSFDAEDAVQETLVRAWRGLDGFEGRASMRTWLYRIATNVCLTMLKGGHRRARPVDLNAPSTAPTGPGDRLPDVAWIEPVPDDWVLPPTADPAERAAAQESIRLAFVAALQQLAPRQRAVLILREVLSWTAAETAQLLDTSVAAVNSALQRARMSLQSVRPAEDDAAQPLDVEQRALLDSYVRAFEQFDLERLTALVDLDVTLSLPPYTRWMRGPEELQSWFSGPGSGCRGSMLCRVTANGSPAFGQYRPGGVPWSLQVVDVAAGRITAISTFLDTERLFPLFGLPLSAPTR